MTYIEIKNIDYSLNKRDIFKNASLTINANECIAIIGKNGSGKSTLLRLIAGLILPSKGKIKRNIQVIGYVPEQPPKSLNFTMVEYLKHMGKIAGLKSRMLSLRIEELITQFGVNEYKNTFIKNLSKGNKQKVNIMQALLCTPDLLLLDEPLSGLDINSQKGLLGVLLTFKKEGMVILFTCHGNVLREKLADRTIQLAKQQIQEVVEAELETSYRMIEFFGVPSARLPLIVNNPSIVDVVRRSSESYEIKVFSTKSDEMISQILELGGSILFVSHQSMELQKRHK